jgi:predicted DsbA family dithiol-disulfide isomerase
VAEKIRIDFVSDVVCPWCAVGLWGLKAALAKLGDEVAAEIVFHPFELNPDMSPEGQNTTEHVRQKYGSTPERSAASRQALKDAGAQLGFAFNYGPDSRIWNTFDAHRLLHWAGLKGKQQAMKEALLKVTFTDQKNPGDVDVLVAAAKGVGLDGDEARDVFTSGRYADEVRKEEDLWRNRGIQAVPSMIFNQRWMIQGGQPPEVFVQAIRQIVAGTAQEEARA